MPTGLTAENADQGVRLRWNANEAAKDYQIQRKPHSNLNYEKWDTTTKTGYLNLQCTSGTAYDYQIRARITDGKNSYYSCGNVVSCIPLTKPQITKVSSQKGVITISWEEVEGAQEVQIYRSAKNDEQMELYDTIKGENRSYTDKNVENGIQYFYKIVVTKTAYGNIDGQNASNTVGVFGKK